MLSEHELIKYYWRRSDFTLLHTTPLYGTQRSSNHPDIYIIQGCACMGMFVQQVELLSTVFRSLYINHCWSTTCRIRSPMQTYRLYDHYSSAANPSMSTICHPVSFKFRQIWVLATHLFRSISRQVYWPVVRDTDTILNPDAYIPEMLWPPIVIGDVNASNHMI